MIRILKESDNERLTDEEIQKLYDEQKMRINNKVQSIVDIIIEKLPKFIDNISDSILKDYISSYYIDDNNDIIIIGETDDFEERMQEIKEIKQLQNASDSIIESDINDIIEKIITNE